MFCQQAFSENAFQCSSLAAFMPGKCRNIGNNHKRSQQQCLILFWSETSLFGLGVQQASKQATKPRNCPRPQLMWHTQEKIRAACQRAVLWGKNRFVLLFVFSMGFQWISQENSGKMQCLYNCKNTKASLAQSYVTFTPTHGIEEFYGGNCSRAISLHLAGNFCIFIIQSCPVSPAYSFHAFTQRWSPKTSAFSRSTIKLYFRAIKSIFQSM